MDREALERSLARRLLDHIENRTTDLADDLMELPADVYSRARHDKEVEVLFRDQPLVLCLSGALPEPETYRTVDVCGTPILLTRDARGKVHALANACRHRGVRVADGGGKAKRLTCPFHAWTYELDGRLVRVPVPEAFEGMCLEDKGLVELPVAEGYGLIVGRLRPGPDLDIDVYLGPGLADELAMFAFEDWAPHGEPHVHRVNANWKVTLDTFRENYHFNYLHRRTLASYAYGGVLTFDAFGPHLRNCSALRSIDELKGIPEEEWGDVAQHFSYQYALFPNTSLTFDSRHIELWQILPVDEATSEVVHTAYLRPDLTAEERAKVVDMAPWICETVVDGEDFWVAGRTEPGVRTGLLDTVVFGRNEPAPQHLHRGFDAALAAAEDGVPGGSRPGAPDFAVT
ncbi:aromatic ring-hydroxylating oxygenase subunit alpha [Spirillospora sp. CA-255316]